MSKYKFEIGEKVRCVYESCAAFKKGDILKIRAREFHNDETMIYFFDEFYNGLYEHEIEKLEVNKMKEEKKYTIQEVLVKENIGKKFEFEGFEYEVKGYLNTLIIEDCNGELIDECINLVNIVHGTFTVIEEQKEFKERIKKGDKYYYIALGRNSIVIDTKYYNDETDDKRIKDNNFFETEEEAQEKLNNILEMLK